MPLSQIVTLLKEAIGLDVESIGLGSIERAVKQRLAANGLKTFQEYLDLARKSEAEFRELVEGVVVPETWFFRHPESFAALKTLAPQHKKIRLLSVPCATGEEPFSMAMTLLDAGLLPEQFRIDAVDVSSRVLTMARAGIYGRNSFRSRDLSWRDRYFTGEKADFLLKESVKACVHFRQSNLLDESFLNDEELYDFVFCRNLLIYFDAPTQARAAKRLRQILAPEGLLFVGPAEPGLFIQHEFVSAKVPMAFAFRKQAAKSPPVRIAGPAPIERKKKTLLREPLVAPLARRVAPPARIVAQKAALPAAKSDLDVATRLADEGRLKEAAAICERSLREQGDSARAFYLLGLVRDVAGDAQEANRYYRKTLYLDPKHYEALMHLAFLNEKSGDPGAAALFKSRAQRSKQGAK